MKIYRMERTQQLDNSLEERKRTIYFGRLAKIES